MEDVKYYNGRGMQERVITEEVYMGRPVGPNTQAYGQAVYIA